jgi:penicillin-binding protein 1A
MNKKLLLPITSKKKSNRKGILFIVFCAVMSGIMVGAVLALTQDLPQIRALEAYRPSAITRIYSADKVLIGELYLKKRSPVRLDAIPYYLKAALVATEDRNFYKHSGIDAKGILRAAIKDMRARKFVEGASTITQQLAKTLFLSPQKNMLRKIKEAFLAFQLERRYTKDQILELYLNQIYFGSGAYGVESAAKTFFGKSVTTLNLAESALIAAMPKAPSRYSPLVNKPLALRRRNIVLKQMADTGIISQAICNTAVREPVYLNPAKKEKDVHAPYFISYVKQFLENVIGWDQLYKGGLTISTTLSFKLQLQAEQAVKSGIAALERRLLRNGMSDGGTQCALVALDVKTAGIVAMVGGKDYALSPFNRATTALRQPGSAFKPIVYAMAIERGFSQNKMILDAPVVYPGANHQNAWRPENFSKTFKGEITLREALSSSRNIPAVRLLEMLGPAAVAQFANHLGVTTPLSPDLALALGASETKLIDMVAAYSVFARKGEWAEVFGVLEVLDHRGRIIWQSKSRKKVVMSIAGAAIVTDMLKGVINEGTGRKAKELTCVVAGKTGTTDHYKDALFIGFSPSVAAGVWIGKDGHQTMGEGETGSRAALPVWIDFMSAVCSQPCDQAFDIPAGLTPISMDLSTGLPAIEKTPHSVTALFKSGTRLEQTR